MNFEQDNGIAAIAFTDPFEDGLVPTDIPGSSTNAVEGEFGLGRESGWELKVNNLTCLERILNMKKYLMFLSVAILVFGMLRSAGAVAFPGPDAFGYMGSTIDFDLRNVSGTGDDNLSLLSSGTFVSLDTLDDAVSVVQIGFLFDFYGLTYTEVEVSTNGFMSFTQNGDSGATGFDFAETIPTVGNIDNYIAGWWTDLNPSKGGIIRTETLGPVGSREFVVGFYEVSDFDDPINIINTFEMILHEFTNNIEIQYGQILWDGDDLDDKVAGIENLDGTDGIELIFLTDVNGQFFNGLPLVNGTIIFQNEGFLFTPVPEPSTIALLGIGLAGLVGVGVRRRFNQNS